jgi:hypothetical protein
MNAPLLTSNFSILNQQQPGGEEVTPFPKIVELPGCVTREDRYAELPVPGDPLCFSDGDVA